MRRTTSQSMVDMVVVGVGVGAAGVGDCETGVGGAVVDGKG